MNQYLLNNVFHTTEDVKYLLGVHYGSEYNQRSELYTLDMDSGDYLTIGIL